MTKNISFFRHIFLSSRSEIFEVEKIANKRNKIDKKMIEKFLQTMITISEEEKELLFLSRNNDTNQSVVFNLSKEEELEAKIINSQVNYDFFTSSLSSRAFALIQKVEPQIDKLIQFRTFLKFYNIQYR